MRTCEWSGCTDDGLYPAPWSREHLRRYRWFCLEHVRLYNSAWNYYQGMDDRQVEADLRRDTVWQRPSWPLGSRVGTGRFAGARISDGFGVFGDDAPAASRPPATAEQRAMVVLDLTAPLTVAAVKARYKKLVKIHHPDANGGDKAAEERFKTISDAYRTLMSSLAP
ncbi:MAG: J domain-containing protein [Rhodospirillales bacterium]